MNRIDQLFQRKTQRVLNVYFTAGYPGRDDTGPIIQALAAAGVDLIEVGMPYSDPLADGPTIQASGAAALQNGMTLPLLFEQLRAVRPLVDTPLVLMGYFNQVLQYGEDRFVADCVAAGVDGLILPDLPLYEYQVQLEEKLKTAGLGVSFLVTPQTSPARIKLIDELSRGFIYLVSSAAVTGAQAGISPEQEAYFARVAAMDLQNPLLIGFGIADHETFAAACRHAHGAIIGSAFIRALGHGHTDLKQTIFSFVNGILGSAQSTQPL